MAGAVPQDPKLAPKDYRIYLGRSPGKSLEPQFWDIDQGKHNKRPFANQ